MNKMSVKVIADSISESGVRIITIHARYPRIIHSEVMTHRVFSRNARSSRAVPLKTMLEEIRNDPFVPWHWGKNQSGMQASEECDERVLLENFDFYAEDEYDQPKWHREIIPYNREAAWRTAAMYACDVAEAFMKAGYHKQVANRLLEPFMYIDTLITSTSWENFFHLRDHKDAEPHFQDLARMIKDAIGASTPKLLKVGEWHLPYIVTEATHENDYMTDSAKIYKQFWAGVDVNAFGGTSARDADILDTLKKISVARCARISYKPFDGDASLEKELERYNDLVGSDPLHASPSEHQATPDYYTGEHWAKPQLHGNFTGWKQYRKFLANEFVPDHFNQ